jgi:hypothetical protein
MLRSERQYVIHPADVLAGTTRGALDGDAAGFARPEGFEPPTF